MDFQTVGRPMEILLVEDSVTDAGLAMIALEDGGVRHRMTLLRNGDEAMLFLRRAGRFAIAPRPDLMLLDLGLPGKDGRELLEEIRSDEDLESIPVVIMTASESYEDYIRSEQLQVNGYVTKPVDLGKFLQLVREVKPLLHERVILPAGV